MAISRTAAWPCLLSTANQLPTYRRLRFPQDQAQLVRIDEIVVFRYYPYGKTVLSRHAAGNRAAINMFALLGTSSSSILLGAVFDIPPGVHHGMIDLNGYILRRYFTKLYNSTYAQFGADFDLRLFYVEFSSSVACVALEPDILYGQFVPAVLDI